MHRGEDVGMACRDKDVGMVCRGEEDVRTVCREDEDVEMVCTGEENVRIVFKEENGICKYDNSLFFVIYIFFKLIWTPLTSNTNTQFEVKSNKGEL